jgi:hypothetical protein
LNRIILALGIAVLVAGAPVSAFLPAAEAAGDQTAQSIMVNFVGLTEGDTYTVVENKRYKFNETTAAGYFTNTLDSTPPTTDCNGSPANCASTNQPAAPTAPLPDPLKVNGTPQGPGAVQDNACTFVSGGTLVGTTYTQSSSTVPGLNGSGNWKFIWSYTIAPTTNPVAPLTAWDLVQTTGDGFAVNADIAGESVLKSSNPKLGTKFSFSLLDSLGVSRVTGLNVAVYQGTSTTPTNYPATSTYVKNAPGAKVGEPGAVDFFYTENAGHNGVVSLLQNNQQARTILNTDNFAGNNDGGADGSALAKVTLDPVALLSLATDDYKITLTGTVKGNSASADIGFKLSTNIHFITPGCGHQS